MTVGADFVHPNPFDGLVHLLKEVKVEKGGRYIDVKCGAKMPVYRGHDPLGGACGFQSLVTCPACLVPSTQPQ